MMTAESSRCSRRRSNEPRATGACKGTRAAIVSGANLEAGIAGQRYAESLKGLATVAILGTSRTCAKSG